MGTLLRCVGCDKEMVIEPVHAGRVVPCPWCRAPVEVPKNLDFRAANAAARTDERAGGGLLAVAIIGLVLICAGVGAPISAVVWWIAHGRLQRARDDGRPADPVVASARTVAAIGTIVGVIGLAFFLAARL